MNKVQASLFLLLQESLWTDFQVPQDEQEVQDFISARFLAIYKRVSENSLLENNNLDTRAVRKLNQENLSRFSRAISLDNLDSISPNMEGSVPSVTENAENEIERNPGKDILYINENSDDVKPMFMIGDFSSQEEPQEMFPDHTYRMLPQGIEKIRESIKLGRLQKIQIPVCPYEGNGCPKRGDECPTLAAMSVEELLSILRAVIEF